jgi:predicted small secreted protein
MVRKFVTLALLAGSFMVAACNTVEGAGKDLQSAGEATQDVAK